MFAKWKCNARARMAGAFFYCRVENVYGEEMFCFAKQGWEFPSEEGRSAFWVMHSDISADKAFSPHMMTNFLLTAPVDVGTAKVDFHFFGGSGFDPSSTDTPCNFTGDPSSKLTLTWPARHRDLRDAFSALCAPLAIPLRQDLNANDLYSFLECGPGRGVAVSVDERQWIGALMRFTMRYFSIIPEEEKGRGGFVTLDIDAVHASVEEGGSPPARPLRRPPPSSSSSGATPSPNGEGMVGASVGLLKFCGACNKPGSQQLSPLRCGQCRAVYYCNRVCQRRAWKTHKRACKEAAAAWQTHKRACKEAAAAAAASTIEEEGAFI